MNETEQNKKAAVAINEDWDIIPFDEAEDDRRWAQLLSEVDELIAQNDQLDTELAASPRQNKKPRRKTLEPPPAPAAEYELF